MAVFESVDLRAIPSLEPLCQIADELKIEIVLHGGTASRLAMYLSYREDKPSIFDLVPFTSDVDLDHSGPANLTTAVMRAIEEKVPFASWFRWSINDGERAQAAAINRALSTFVPLRSIRASTAGATPLQPLARADLDRRVVSLHSNPGYQRSLLAMQGRDVELFGHLMALNTAAELADISGSAADTGKLSTGEEKRAGSGIWQVFPSSPPLWRDFLRSRREDFRKVAQSRQLAARFWHLFVTLLARRGWDEAVTALYDEAKYNGVDASVGVSPENLHSSDRCIGVSRVTGSGAFRLKDLTPKIATGKSAEGELISLYRVHGKALKGPLPERASDVLDPAFELVAVVPRLTLQSARLGESSNDPGPFYSEGVQAPGLITPDFIEIAWKHPLSGTLKAKGLAAQVIAWSDIARGECCPLPAVGGVFGADRPWIRARIDGFAHAGGEDAALVVLQARRLQ